MKTFGILFTFILGATMDISDVAKINSLKRSAEQAFLNQNYEEAARCYLQTLSLNPAAMHCWSYLRIALSCSEKWDLIPLAASRDLAAFRDHYDFVLYENEAATAGISPDAS